MTASTLPGRHQMEMTDLPLAPAPARLSTRGWAALRRSATVLVFVVATVAGVTLGLRGAQVSPVAPPIASESLGVPAAVGPAAVTIAAPPGPDQPPDGGPGGQAGRGGGGGGGHR